MINLIIEKETKKKKNYVGTILTGVAIYTLFKITLSHEMELIQLKKMIKGMKSKGE